MDGTTPRVSVILPACNAERHVAAAVGSILGQTLADLEVVAIDDGSTDATADILSRSATDDRRLRVVGRPHRGRSRTLNEGLELATAPYVAIMNAADVALPGRLEAQAAFLDAHPHVAAVGGQTRAFLDGGTPGPVTALPTDPAAARALLARASPLAHPAVMMRRQAVLAAGGYRPALEPAEDYDLWLRLAEGHDLANLPDVVLHDRLHDGPATEAVFERVAAATLAARELARLRSAGRPEPPAAETDAAERLAGLLGVPARDIAGAAIHAALGRAESLLGAGGTPTAVRGTLAALAGSAAAATAPALYEAARSWLEGRILAAGGRYAAAVPRFVEAAVAEAAFRARLAGAIGRRVNAAMASPSGREAAG